MAGLTVPTKFLPQTYLCCAQRPQLRQQFTALAFPSILAIIYLDLLFHC
jgi:hypothetical protein